MTPYCSVQDVQESGADPNATDAQILRAINRATFVINAIIPVGFGTQITEARTFDDIRNNMVVLPQPFSAITDVSVGNFSLPTNQYALESWGIRIFSNALLYDASGLPMTTYSEIAPLNSYGLANLGYPVKVTATWGEADVPNAVKEATIVLALDYLGGSGDPISGMDTAKVSSVSVEGFSVSFRDQGANLGRSTGNLLADRLLVDFMPSNVGVL